MRIKSYQAELVISTFVKRILCHRYPSTPVLCLCTSQPAADVSRNAAFSKCRVSQRLQEPFSGREKENCTWLYFHGKPLNMLSDELSMSSDFSGLKIKICTHKCNVFADSLACFEHGQGFGYSITLPENVIHILRFWDSTKFISGVRWVCKRR